jgi:Fur family transcriptional regulator, ferric uptake regulator
MVLAGEKQSRMTKQRQVILEELQKVCTHPSADELYGMVRDRLPRISLGTVYRNLEMLASSGLIQKLETVGAHRRFDGNPEAHYHVRCVRCGKVGDVEVQLSALLDDVLRTASDYEIWGHRLEFVGLCPQCKQTERAVRGEEPGGAPGKTDARRGGKPLAVESRRGRHGNVPAAGSLS